MKKFGIFRQETFWNKETWAQNELGVNNKKLVSAFKIILLLMILLVTKQQQ